MQIRAYAWILGILLGLVGYFIVILFSGALWMAFAAFAILAGAGLAMTQPPIIVRELVKQIGVWIGLVALLPLAVWYGTSAFSPPPDAKHYSKSTERLDERIRDTKKESEKEKLRDEKDRLESAHDEAERVYYGHMFWVAYPIGLAAFIVGIFFPVQAVGAGLLFGGLASLSAGCYSYWDKMGGWLRFGSLLVALLIVLVLGAWRFRTPLEALSSPETSAS